VENWLISTEGLRDFPRLNYAAVIFGGLVALCGLLLFCASTPSPHGFIEELLAIPMLCFGLVVTGIGLLTRFSLLNWSMRLVAIVMTIAGVFPLLQIAAFLVRS
jgi:hypothetical protein